MYKHRRRKRGRCRGPALFLLSTLLCTLVLLLPTLYRPHTISFPQDAALRAEMGRCNQALLESVQAAAASGAQLIPPGEDGLLIPNWREIAALSVVTDIPLDTLFSQMIRLEPEGASLFFPSADGSIPLTPRSPARIQVVCRDALEAVPTLTRRQRSDVAALLSPNQDGQWQALAAGPLDLDPELEALCAALLPSATASRRALVEAACTLVGRVGYFWGGKSHCVGWDTRWGVPALVTAPGGSDTGQVLPYGLDCSGLVSWAAATAMDDPGASQRVGEGVRAQYAACQPVDWQDVQPGDFLFFPDLSHVGIAAGVSAEGAVDVIHCSHSLGGVVLTRDARAAGFSLAGTPALF